jgi:Tfp pilus assembly protein PilF
MKPLWCRIVLLLACAPLTLGAQVVTDRNRQDALRHYSAGSDALRHEKFDVAEREFKEAIKLDPTLDLAHYGLGQTYMATKRYPLAVRAYLNCRETFTANASAALTDQTAAQQRLDDEIRMLEDDKRNLETGVLKTANTQATIQRLEVQINGLKFQRHRGADAPVGTPAWISLALGSAFFRNEEMLEAEHEFLEALKAEPKLGEAHNNLAVLYFVSGKLSDADRELNAAEASGFKINPQFKADLKKALAGGG